MTVDIAIEAAGPLFEGRIRPAITAACRESEDQIGAQASANLHTLMNHYFRHPTPYYETQVTLQRSGDQVVLHDRGIVYGPWLEGIGSRNQTTRFKGYAHWRQAAQQTNAQASRLAENAFRRRLEGA